MAGFNQQALPPLVPTSALRERAHLDVSRPAKTPAYFTWGQIAPVAAEDGLLWGHHCSHVAEAFHWGPVREDSIRAISSYLRAPGTHVPSLHANLRVSIYEMLIVC